MWLSKSKVIIVWYFIAKSLCSLICYYNYFLLDPQIEPIVCPLDWNCRVCQEGASWKNLWLARLLTGKLLLIPFVWLALVSRESTLWLNKKKGPNHHPLLSPTLVSVDELPHCERLLLSVDCHTEIDFCPVMTFICLPLMTLLSYHALSYNALNHRKTAWNAKSSRQTKMVGNPWVISAR